MWYCTLFHHNLTRIVERCFTDVSAAKGVYVHACRCGRRFMAYKSPWFSDKLGFGNWGTDLYFSWVNRSKNDCVAPTYPAWLLWFVPAMIAGGYMLLAFTRYRLLHLDETSVHSLWHIIDILFWA